ncbi:MvaI/BcnI family restriction endonuclease [Photobacterium leiognathi]|uniref:MvaI/BcnI family restriction endonuclease n=1 Tax=Photobacterium leiognathi TaxID=553611 RepID=UPI002981549A|nr:MvaI/BcnI family restriction endonuclease [Photobacterium leiognathi]
MKKLPLPSLLRFKQQAKLIKKEFGISQTEALELASKKYGFKNWPECNQYYVDLGLLAKKTPEPTANFVEDGDIEMSEDDYDIYENERSQDFDIEIKRLVEENQKQLAKLGIEYSIFEPTVTGLKKSILDATYPVRLHFEQENYHFYRKQEQGPEYKVVTDAVLLTQQKAIKSKVSLYRPVTKKGDPRMWFTKLSELAEAGDQIAIVINNQVPHLINLSKNRLAELSECSPIKNFFTSYIETHSGVSSELLGKLKNLAKKPFKAQRVGDTAIGYTLESLLGIEANSSKLPDYKGIELKAGRGKKTRTTLFAQVADWKISPCKRSADILNRYGYEREDDFKLYCTISTQKENTQGLSFKYDKEKDELQEWYKSDELVAIWPGELLRKRLKEKHSETFWIEARSENINGEEQFELISVTHTKSPLVNQLFPLIESGVITMDHLIKRSGKTNKVSEKGPLFKMNKRDLALLFPAPITYKLK